MIRLSLELSRWGDGKIRLVYWDSVEGNDIIFTLGETDLDAALQKLLEDEERRDEKSEIKSV